MIWASTWWAEACHNAFPFYHWLVSAAHFILCIVKLVAMLDPVQSEE